MARPTTDVRFRIGPGEPPLTDRLAELASVDASDWTVVLLPAASDHEDAASRFGIEVKNARRALSAAGASDEQVAVVADELESLGHQAGPAIVVVAADDCVVVSGPLPEAPDEAFVDHGAVPALIPILDLERHQIAYLAVLIDREGADLTVVPRSGAITAEQIQGDVDVIHQPKAGGWSQPRFQQRARNTWDENAADVADHVAELARLVDAELIVVSGDPKARPRLLDHLPETLRALTVTDDGPSRGHHDGLDDLLETAVADHVARRTKQTLHELRDALGAGRALEGPEAVDVLGEGRIGRVVVSHDRRSGLRGRIGLESGTIVGTQERREQLDEDAAEVGLADLAVWGALRFGADIDLAPGGAAAPNAGVAGFLRG